MVIGNVPVFDCDTIGTYIHKKHKNVVLCILKQKVIKTGKNQINLPQFPLYKATKGFLHLQDSLFIAQSVKYVFPSDPQTLSGLNGHIF